MRFFVLNLIWLDQSPRALQMILKCCFNWKMIFLINQFSQNATGTPERGAGWVLTSVFIKRLYLSWESQIMKWWSHSTENEGPRGESQCLPRLGSRLQPLPSPPGHPIALRLSLWVPALPASCRSRSSSQSIWSCRLLLRTFSPGPCRCAAPRPLQKNKTRMCLSPWKPSDVSLLSFPPGEPDLLKGGCFPLRTQNT